MTAHGPVHIVDSGRYQAVIRDGVPMIERADTAGAVLAIERPAPLSPPEGAEWDDGFWAVTAKYTP